MVALDDRVKETQEKLEEKIENNLEFKRLLERSMAEIGSLRDDKKKWKE